jgi:hypothetical protein
MRKEKNANPILTWQQGCGWQGAKKKDTNRSSGAQKSKTHENHMKNQSADNIIFTKKV